VNICVYGASSRILDEKYILPGVELGNILAERGHTLVYGGGATGLMGAVARGVKEKGGYVTGIIPTFFTNEEVLFLGADRVIRTEGMRDRKTLLEKMSDAYIITTGGVGTYDELFEILTLKQLKRHNKAIVILNTEGFYDKMLEALEYAMGEKVINRSCERLFAVFNTPKEAVDYIEGYQPIQLEGLK